MPLGDFIVVINHLLTTFLILQDLSHFLNFFLGKKTIHDNQIKAFRFNVSDKNRVSVNQYRLLEINGLKESITKSFVQAWVSNKIGIWIHIPQSIEFFIKARLFPRISYLGCHKIKFYPQTSGIISQPFSILKPFITCLMRDYQLVSRIA